MNLNRRDFLKYLTVSAAALGYTLADLRQITTVLAQSAKPPVVWLQRSSCNGCSVSLLEFRQKVEMSIGCW